MVLDHSKPYKPLDFGNGLLAGSVADGGRLAMLGTTHPEHGWIVLDGAGPFPEAQRHDPAAVRAYRARLAATDAPAFGLFFPGTQARAAELGGDGMPRLRLAAGVVEFEVVTAAPAGKLRVPAAVQRWTLHNTSNSIVELAWRWEGGVGLGRAAYTQLTERGPLPRLPSTLYGSFDGSVLLLVAPGIAAAVIAGLPAAEPWQAEDSNLLHPRLGGTLRLKAGESRQYTLVVGLAPDEAAARLAARQASGWSFPHHRDAPQPVMLELVRRRAETYAQDCCAVEVGATTCLLTDHRILPLSWTRDAYYTLLGLAARQDVHQLRRRHLRWLWEVAERPLGYWGRAYLANGRPKDDVFQLDQQCYPLLELAEHLLQSPDEFGRGLLLRAGEVLDTMLARRAGDQPLFATDETPADDPMLLPFHFSSHVLLWHTLRTLARADRDGVLAGYAPDELAEAIHAAVRARFVVTVPDGNVFAYAVDGHGGHRLYHDANDLPTVLAPLWGFCGVDDPVWRATMEWSFGPGNVEGWFAGPFGGLGSVHTPGAWPLGDTQELLWARLTGDAARAEQVLGRLTQTACWDGALPEARDPDTGEVRSRHWFAWPGAALLATLDYPDWQPA